MGDAIDLTLSDSEGEEAPTAAEPNPAKADRDAARQDDEAARKRIMDFARNKAANKRIKPAADDATPMPQADDQQVPVAAAAAAGACGIPAANAQLRELHEARMRHQQQQQAASAEDGGAGSGPAAAEAPAAAPGPSSSGKAACKQQAPPAEAASAPGNRSISLLTYNVWFKEELAVLERMMAIGDCITRAGHPTFVCLQEVTPLILELFMQMSWWQHYVCSDPPIEMPYFTLLLVNKVAAPGLRQSGFSEAPFGNSVMGRSLRSVRVEVAGRSLCVATSHLESPIPPHSSYSEQRQWQMRHSLQQLEASGVDNMLFAGDLNWDEKRDGSPALPAGWQDAWPTLQPERPGFTYDTKNNPMMTFKGLQLRLDRIFCKLQDWRLQSIEMLGTQPLPGVQHTHRFSNGGSKDLPVLPSDHFGLLVRLEEACNC